MKQSLQLLPHSPGEDPEREMGEPGAHRQAILQDLDLLVAERLDPALNSRVVGGVVKLGANANTARNTRQIRRLMAASTQKVEAHGKSG